MSVTINKDGADAYFAEDNHIQAAVWAGFEDTLKTAAIAQAIRQLDRALGSTLTSETAVTTDSYQPAYAAYEQALYLLVNSNAISNDEETAPAYQAVDNVGEPRKQDSGVICAEARRWMDWQTGKTISFAKG